MTNKIQTNKIQTNKIQTNKMRPIHPGEILREEYLVELSLSGNALALALRVPSSRINQIVQEKRGISPDTALRLARYFGGDAQSWLNLQTAYDLKVAQLASDKQIAAEVLPLVHVG